MYEPGRSWKKRLRGAKIFWGNLRGAKISGEKIRGMKKRIRGAKIVWENLRGAKILGEKIRGVNFFAIFQERLRPGIRT